MIASSSLAKAGALLLAVALHGALGLGLHEESPARLAGGDLGAPARIGTGFADLAAGTLSPAATTVATPATTPAVTPPAEPIPTARSPAPRTALPAPRAPAVTPRATAVDGPARTAPPVSTLTAHDPAAHAPDRSARPVERPDRTSARPGRAAPAGNAARDAAAGVATGRAEAVTRRSGTAATPAATQGNAATGNYPGKVMRRIARVPRPAIGVTGTATVAFTVAPGGGLGSVGIARSSGSAALDQAALRMIRRAAPFPAPPPGAQRRFTLRVTGK